MSSARSFFILDCSLAGGNCPPFILAISAYAPNEWNGMDAPRRCSIALRRPQIGFRLILSDAKHLLASVSQGKTLVRRVCLVISAINRLPF